MYPNQNKYRNVFKGFRDISPYAQSSNFSKSWDEPTFLTFSVFFRLENVEAIYTGYDRFPMPLLNPYIQDDYFSAGGDTNNPIQTRTQYSTINFLRDSNEFVRANLLGRLINDINHLQSFYQWYFQGISGLQSILAVDPKRGRRVAEDAKITMTMLEGLDQKMFNILNLYKQIAWDSKWQRWILPDMMRYFSMDIYVTEFRTFHTPSIRNAQNPNSNSLTTILTLLEDTMPTYKIVCERCEFDIESINRQIDSYSVAESPEQMKMEFDIKIGNAYEEYINPILDYYYNDKILNGLDRTKEYVDKATQNANQNTSEPEGVTTFNNSTGANYDPTRVSTNPHAYSNSHILAQGQLLAERYHIPGTPFYEQANNQASIKQSFGTVSQPPPGATFKPDFDPTNQSTWAGNAVNFGGAFVQNFVESAIDKAKMTPIPGLGVSVNEAIGALESKNFSTVFGLIRNSIARNYQLSAATSSGLDSGIDIIDSTFRQFLSGVAQSEATSKEGIELQQYADLALSDRGTFDRIKDLSLATDLISTSSTLIEQNTPNPIENADAYRQIVDQQTQGDRSFATDLDGKPKVEKTAPITEGIPTSAATSNRIIKG